MLPDSDNPPLVEYEDEMVDISLYPDLQRLGSLSQPPN
jgi:hypothetical protein